MGSCAKNGASLFVLLSAGNVKVGVMVVIGRATAADVGNGVQFLERAGRRRSVRDGN